MSDSKKIVGVGIIIIFIISTIIILILNIDSVENKVSKTNNKEIILNNSTEDSSYKNIPAEKPDTNKSYIEEETSTSTKIVE